ncbi:cytochrome c-type biogenesis protein [Natranaerovirga pectinivora]|uniref:Cytochrome c-type biogenesis protein n=1 Tax=Natranaerovirga pectinivora TaxID=682400 RepID=A0A4R3MJG6_9FIRM|nr:cytochrome c biogenesis protein CcdA [Natranaerovirga pectinivora]TCT14260.1 cytochrome c-type biogenesis protein [Natranaerovirga pectinivora]
MNSLIQLDVNGFMVFWGGIVSFLSPCIFPLLPVYFSMLAGSQIGSEDFDQKAKRDLIFNSIAFLLGISLVFIIIGITANAIGRGLLQYMDIIRKAGGIFVIFLGFNYIGLINIKFINKEKKYRLNKYNANFSKSFLLGLVFSFGWTPCISSFLTPVLIMATVQSQLINAVGLLMIYAVGFSIPFLLLAILTSIGINKMQGIYKYMNTIRIISGLLLIIMGVLLYTNYLNILSFGLN